MKRALGKDTIVIADGLNYIKGFRYQLYCEAKAVQTPSCVVRIPSSNDTRDKADEPRGPYRNANRQMSRD